MGMYSYNKYSYSSEIKVIEEKINKTKVLLNNCYIDNNLSYENKLKISSYMDKLINKYYRLKKNTGNSIN